MDGFMLMKRKMRNATRKIVVKEKNTMPLQVALRLSVKTGYFRFTKKLVSGGPTKTVMADI